MYFATQRRFCHCTYCCLLQIKSFLHDSVTKARSLASNNAGEEQDVHTDFPATVAAIQGVDGLPVKIGRASGGDGREREMLLVSDGV
jgi:hypothetical protein